MQPGNAALFVLIKNMTPDKVLREIQDAGGTVLKTSLDDSKEQQASRRAREGQHRAGSAKNRRRLSGATRSPQPPGTAC